MEHAQREVWMIGSFGYKVRKVLILVLVEHAQREHFFVRLSVLICYIEIFTLINVFASKNVSALCLRHCKDNESF